jgi:hypothetical protein
MENEKELILYTLEDYIQGGSTKDIERLRLAFHPNAKIRSVRAGALIQWSLEEYIDIVAGAPVMERRSEILSYTFDGYTGAAHLRLNYKNFRFIDRFNLAKVEGRWLIVDKIFHREEFAESIGHTFTFM